MKSYYCSISFEIWSFVNQICNGRVIGLDARSVPGVVLFICR
nr:MAG TPA_asm: hypothetical protein [Caudoviricetes sp.]